MEGTPQGDGARMVPPGVAETVEDITKAASDLKTAWNTEKRAILAADNARQSHGGPDPLFDAFLPTYWPSSEALKKAGESHPENYATLAEKGRRCHEAYLTMDNASARAFTIVQE